MNAQSFVIEYLREHPAATPADIVFALDERPSFVSELLEKLRGAGFLRGGGGEPWTVLDVLQPVGDESADHPAAS